ncbi:MAG: 1-deoxy-D-xylulose-5-phosphate reductoisomerase [Chloroflexi bacterium]|nr:1-deoxy-D-xylulose-5-phosphate reductoisomerase [Chloroflexota bacterium]
MKKLAVLGSTGSIGRQTLDVARAFPEHLRVTALAAGRNRDLLLEQVREFKPRLFCCSDVKDGQDAFRAAGCEEVSLEEMAVAADVDMVVVATSGKAGLKPALAALEQGKPVALANKEVLVMAGALVTEAARRTGASLLPIDSEHSAIWQCLRGEGAESDGCKGVSRLILTASGGAFRDRPLDTLAVATAADALKHPTWLMGEKITIDSATLMNKGLETLEAHWLFGLPLDKIDILIHRQSIIHSMVEFVDGSLKAQLGPPDMRLPIQYALSYPLRWPNRSFGQLDLSGHLNLTFEQVDERRYPCLGLAIEAGRTGGTYPAVLNGADEAAVGLFLQGRVGFGDIAVLVRRVLDAHVGTAKPSLDEVLAADAWARERVRELVEG